MTNMVVLWLLNGRFEMRTMTRLAFFIYYLNSGRMSFMVVKMCKISIDKP